MYIQYNGLSILYFCKRSSDNYVNEVSSGHLSMKQKHASRVKRWEDAGELLPDPEIPVQHYAIYCTYLLCTGDSKTWQTHKICNFSSKKPNIFFYSKKSPRTTIFIVTSWIYFFVQPKSRIRIRQNGSGPDPQQYRKHLRYIHLGYIHLGYIHLEWWWRGEVYFFTTKQWGIFV